MFSKDVYVRRRQLLLSKMFEKGAKGIAVFLGNVDAPRNYRGNDYGFRQDSTFLYFWGIDQQRFAATIDLETGEEVIYADDVDIDDIIWMGPQPKVSEIAAGVGVSKTASYSCFDKVVARAEKVHFLPVSRYYNAIKLSSLLGLNPDEVVISGKGGCPKASAELTESVISLRLVKETVEIEEIDKACDLGYAMHTIARQGIKVGNIEQTIVGAMEGIAIAGGCGTSFPTILTQHGEIFHCHSHDCVIEAGKLLVIDAGVESNSHYASDFTRTYPTAGKFTTRQKDIYNIVCDCNNYAFSLIKPGTAYLDVHQAVAKKMLEGLKDLGLVNGNVDDLVAEGIAGLFMPHGLGHNMGMDVHDMEDLGENLVGYDPDQKRSSKLGLASLRMARRLVPGNIITDEPGIYFIPDLIELWKKEGTDKGMVNYNKLATYYDFGGIRLEDDVLVTADGCRRMGSKRLPITVEEVESAMAAE